jgi:hypothetical protein
METNNLSPVLAVAKIDLKKLPETVGSYVVCRVTGNLSNTFLGVYRKNFRGHRVKGVPFLAIEKGVKYNEAMANRNSHFIYTTNDEAVRRKRLLYPNKSDINRALITGFNFAVEFPNRGFGDGGIYNDHAADALLLEFSENKGELSIWLFEKMKFYAQSIFEKWCSQELALAVREDVACISTTYWGRQNLPPLPRKEAGND